MHCWCNLSSPAMCKWCTWCLCCCCTACTGSICPCLPHAPIRRHFISFSLKEIIRLRGSCVWVTVCVCVCLIRKCLRVFNLTQLTYPPARPIVCSASLTLRLPLLFLCVCVCACLSVCHSPPNLMCQRRGKWGSWYAVLNWTKTKLPCFPSKFGLKENINIQCRYN